MARVRIEGITGPKLIYGEQQVVTPPVPSLFRQTQEDNGRRPSTIIGLMLDKMRNLERVSSWQVATPDNFTIFEGTSEIQRMIIGGVVTGLDVR